MTELIQILVSLDGDTYRVGVQNLVPDDQELIHGVQYHRSNGDLLEEPQPITFPLSSVVSERPIHRPPDETTIYHFSRDHDISASEYARAGQDRLTPVTNHGLGSGIYGLHLPNKSASQTYRRNRFQSVYPIPCFHCFYLQDAEHGNSLTQASKYTDRYVDFMVDSIRRAEPERTWQEQPSLSEPICNEVGASGYLADIITHMRAAETEPSNDIPTLDGLHLLWNNVLARESRQIMLPLQAFVLMMGSYILLYVSNPGRLIPEPVTYLLVALGFDSVIADDSYNNSFTRGCVRYCPFTDLPPKIQNQIEYNTRAQRLGSQH
jgi:hypothetical protein